ncbi:MAG: PHB depolymerase family esterase [Pirellulaceae bacterium]
MHCAQVLLLALWGASPLTPGDHTRTVTIGGENRTYIAHVPPGYDPQVAIPVVLAFHGGGSNSEQMVRFCRLNDKADQACFLAVYPNGTGRLARMLTFNGGNCCGFAMNNQVDDVEFTRRILDDLAVCAKVDTKRVYATGMSNGGIMAYRLAAELSERIAAIAPVGGPMGTETCQPQRPVSVIHFHGTDDQFAPFTGGKGNRSLSGTDFYSVEHSIRAWVTANACSTEPVVTTLPDKAGDGTTITRKTYGNGRDGAEVVLVEVHGGGHTWPGQVSALRWLGKSTRNISANDAMWEFFQNHPMK